MSNKYIIKNCPACRQYQVGIYTCDDFYDCDLQRCQDCTDCVIKQIVKLCEQYKKDYNTTNGVWLLANNITNLLDIREVE